MMSEGTTLIRLAALCLAFAPLPAALAFSETDLATLKETGSCSGCDLAGADLYEADLFQANLSGADLRDADLTAADLTLADLRGADLRGAILEETNLSGANLTVALLDKDALAGAIFDSERTRTTLGFKDLKLGMNVVEVAQYCSIESIDIKTNYLANILNSSISQLEGTCFDNADMPFTFKFSRGGYAYQPFFTSPATGVLSFLQVGLAPYTEQGQRKFIDLLAKKYKPARSYSAQDVEAFNNNRDLDMRLHTIFANGQVTLSVVGEGSGLQMLLTYRAKENGERFLKRKGGPAPVDLAHLPPITTDLYKLVGNYKLKGIGAKGTSTNHGRIDTAYLEIDAFENELAGELVISGHRMSERFRIIGIKTISNNRLTVQLEPVTGTIPDGELLRMSLEFSEDGDSFTGKWTNWFRLKNAKTRRPDDFKGSRSQSFWQTAMSHNRIDMYQAYLRLRPGGIYSAVARSRITALGGALPAPSAPTVSTAVTASPSTSVTPTTTTTTAVDPLVGVWQLDSWYGTWWSYLMVGIDDQGGLTGFSWQGAHSGAFGFREITIESLSDESYSWHSDQSVSPVNPSFATGAAADGGKFWVSENEDGLPKVTSSKELFAQPRGIPPRQTLQKIALEEALALELPPEVPQDFPSPFATEGTQVVSVPKATAVTSASPSTPTTTTATAVDPLVGIWHWQGGVWGYADNCYLAVGINDQGVLEGKSWETHQRLDVFSAAEEIIGFNIVGVRDIAIGQVNDDSYTWKTEETLPRAGDYWIKGGLTGKLYLNMKDQNVESLDVNNRICRKRRSESKNSRFKKLTLEEALALELPPELLQDFPSPFVTEGPQVASVPTASASASAAPSTPTTTATAVDPLVGIWHWQGGAAWSVDNCYLAVGSNNQGVLVGKSWETHQQMQLVVFFTAEEIIGFNIVGVRDIAIGQVNDDSYTWKTEKTLPRAGEYWTKGGLTGKLYLNMKDQDVESLDVNNRICRKMRSESKNSRFKKLPLEEALALELPPELLQDFPSPFATEGPQVASVPKASASASPSTPTTTTPVDPLVGIWTRASGFYGECHFIVGQRDDGTLTAVSFQGFLRRNVIGNDSLIEWGLTDAGVGILARAISIKRTPKGAYSWESSDNFQSLGLPGFMANPPKKGRLSISKDKGGNPRVTSNKWLCVEERAAPPTGTYRKLSLDEAIAMKLPSIAQKDFPSPFATEGQQVVSVPNSSASASTSPSTPTTATTTTVDPLVGVWHWQGGFGYSDNCYLAVGMNDQGALVGKSWETHQKTHLDTWFTAEEIIGFNIVGVRDITIGQMNTGSFTWKTEETLQAPRESWTKGGLTGKLYLNMKDQHVESLDVNNRICRKLRSEPKNSRLKKLPLEEALTLELPPELLQGFPSPFATEGPQVASVPKATASASTSPSTSVTPTTTTTTAVDPLVGIWQQTDVVYENCQLVVGQDSSGQLMGVSFSTIRRHKLVSNSGPRYPKGAVDWSPSDSSKGFVARRLTIEQGPGDTYTWTSEISFKGNLWEAPTAKSGKIYLSTDQNGNPRVSTKKLCMVERAAAGGGSFSKLALDEAIAMELPSIAHEDFPSPFQDGTQWSGDVATEVTGAAQTTGATPDSSESDRR